MVRAVAGHRTGYVWTFPSEARGPGQIKPAAALVADGDEDTAAVRQVAGLASAGDGTIGS